MIGAIIVGGLAGIGVLAAKSRTHVPDAPANSSPPANAAPPVQTGGGAVSVPKTATGAAIGGAIGGAAGEAINTGIRATGGTDTTQQGIIKAGTTVIGTAVGGSIAAGVAAGAAAAVAAPIAGVVIGLSGAVSGFINMNRADDNDRKREASIASKGAKATWQDDLAVAVAELKGGGNATEAIGYHDVDPKYFRRGFGGDGWDENTISAVDAFSVYVTPTTATATHDGITKTKTVAGYVDVYKDGSLHPHKMGESEVQNIIANEIAKGFADDKAGAISGFGDGMGTFLAVASADAASTGFQATPYTAQVIGGIAATGSKTDRVIASATGAVSLIRLRLPLVPTDDL